MICLKILAVDQARHGAWSIYNYDNKKLLKFEVFNFDDEKFTFEQAVLQIESLIDGVINAHNIDAVFFEDIYARNNVKSFKRLAQLQGVLANLCEKNEYQYGFIAPSQWQGFCGARGRTEREKKDGETSLNKSTKRQTKILSIQFVKDQFGVDTENDNLADAICIGHYVVNNVDINEDGIIVPKEVKKKKRRKQHG